MSKEFDWDVFKSFPAVGIMRGFETNLALEIADNAFRSGLTNLEVTMNTADVELQIRRICELAPANVNVGAGTVISLDKLDKAIQAGAQYIVTPNVNVSIIRASVEQNIPIFPGAYTPTEVVQAWEAGASAVKLFPVRAGGPDYLKSVKAPLDHIPLLAVDGVDLDNLQSYLDAGASGIGVGTQFFNVEKMLARDWKWMEEQIQTFRKFWL